MILRESWAIQILGYMHIFVRPVCASTSDVPLLPLYPGIERESWARGRIQEPFSASHFAKAHACS